MFKKVKICKICEDRKGNMTYIDFKDTTKLTRFVTDQGKMIPRRTSGNCAKCQRLLKRAIKRARYLALMPYVMDNSK